MNIHDATEQAYRNGYAKGREDALAADVVEVVRCEKCFFAEMVVDIIGDPHLFCAECNFREVDFDDYCSKGKRRENDG